MRYRCWTKARRFDGPAAEPTRSAGWATSRRAWLKVFDDRVECGSWSIPCDAVEEAVVYELRWLFVPVGVLYLRLADESYQFGVNPWARPWDHLPIPVRTEQAVLGWSTFSIVIRLAALAAIIAMVVTRL